MGRPFCFGAATPMAGARFRNVKTNGLHGMTRWYVMVTSVAVALGAASAAAHAQSVQGTLLRADSTPASGVIVVAVRGARDSVLARTMTNGNGRYFMNVPSGEVRLRALRIGHKPVVISEFAVTAASKRDTRTVLPDDPILLQAMTTEATSSCRQVGTAGANVATVFEEARKALLSTQLKSRDADPLARLSLYTQLRSVGNRELSDLEREFQEGVSLKPFQSLKPDSLAKVGYMQSDFTGWTYWAPDADVLLSETFASSHCLRLVEGTDQRAGWIGLAFRPQEFRRNYTDVSGVLWLDRASSELRRMEFKYEGLPIAMQRVASGGDVEFTRLPDGTWFVNKWEIRMPRMTLPPAAPRLVGVSVKGGEVWRMRRGNELLYTNGLEEPKVVAKVAKAEEMPMVSVAADAPCTPPPGSSGTGVLRGTVRDERGAPLADAIVFVEWQENYRPTGAQFAWETRTLQAVSGREGDFAACGFPDRRLLSVSAKYGARKSATVTVGIGAGENRATVDLRIAGARADAVGKGVMVRVLDANTLPIAHALVEVEGGRGRVTDDSGRVVMATAPDTVQLSVRRIGFSPFAGRVARARSGEFEVTLTSLAQRLAAVTVTERGAQSPLERAGFYDRLQRVQRTAMLGEFITPEELDARGLSKISDILQGRRYSSVAKVTSGGHSLSVVLGRGKCAMNIVVDGQFVGNTAQELNVSGVPTSILSSGSQPANHGHPFDLDEIVDGSSVAAIEIYPSIANAPVELIPTASHGACGLVVIWTGGRR